MCRTTMKITQKLLNVVYSTRTSAASSAPIGFPDLTGMAEEKMRPGQMKVPTADTANPRPTKKVHSQKPIPETTNRSRCHMIG